MKKLKKNKSTIVGILVFILVLAGIFAMKSVMSSDEAKAIYGSRLDGIKDVEITKETTDKVEKKISSQATSTNVKVAGRTLEKAKKLGEEAVSVFSDKEKKYYDIQIFITNDKNTEQFPIIGYKHHSNDNISWTKDRAES